MFSVITETFFIRVQQRRSDLRASKESLKAALALAVIVELPGDSMERE